VVTYQLRKVFRNGRSVARESEAERSRLSFFYALYDKISRDEHPGHAYAQCALQNGSPATGCGWTAPSDDEAKNIHDLVLKKRPDQEQGRRRLVVEQTSDGLQALATAGSSDTHHPAARAPPRQRRDVGARLFNGTVQEGIWAEFSRQST